MVSVNYPTAYELASLGKLSNEQRQYMTAGFNQGLSATATLDQMSAAGIGVRATTGYAAFRAISGNHQVGNGFNNVPFPLQPSERLFVPQSFDIGYPYRVWGYVDAVDQETGEIMRLRQVVGFDSIDGLSRQSILEALASGMDNAQAAYGVSFATEDIVITSAESNVQGEF